MIKKITSIQIVGIGFIFLMSVSFYFTIIQQTDNDSKYPYRIKLYYSKIDGIRVGTEVYLNGIQFGQVERFNYIPANEVSDKRFLEYGKSQAIEVVLKIADPLTLWNNYQIRFKNITMFSGRTIEIDPGFYEDESSTHFQPSYKTGGKIPDYSPSAFYYDDFFGASARLIEENRPDLRISVRNLNHISYKLHYGNGTLPQIINNDIIYDALVETTGDMSIIGKEFRRYQESMREYNNVPIPFTINIYRRQTSIGKISNRLYDTTPKNNTTKNLY